MSIHVLRLSCEVPDIFSNLNQIWSFSTDFHKSRQYKNFTEVRRIGAALMHLDRGLDRRTDMTKLIAAFRDYTNVPIKVESARVFVEIVSLTLIFYISV